MERDEQKRALWLRERAEEFAAGSLKAEDLVFIDESGFQRTLTRSHGRAPRGQRVVGKLPQRHGAARRCLSVVGALGAQGLVAVRSIALSFNTERFVGFLREELCPRLRPGQVVVMDNLSVHRAPAVRQAIEACGARVLFLPTYSPDLNPIEKAWSKVKALVRGTLDRALERTKEALQGALDAALAAVNAADAQAWMRLSGYSFTYLLNPL